MSNQPKAERTYVLHCDHTGYPVGEADGNALKEYFRIIGRELPPELRDQEDASPEAPVFVPPAPDMK